MCFYSIEPFSFISSKHTNFQFFSKKENQAYTHLTSFFTDKIKNLIKFNLFSCLERPGVLKTKWISFGNLKIFTSLDGGGGELVWETSYSFIFTSFIKTSSRQVLINIKKREFNFRFPFFDFGFKLFLVYLDVEYC